MGGHTSVVDRERFSARKMGNMLQTYVFDVFQVFGVGHLSLDQFENDTIKRNDQRLP